MVSPRPRRYAGGPNPLGRHERVGVITCGYEEDQWWEPGPAGSLIFAWRRRAVDLAVCNSQGGGALDWWPMYEDARRGDIVIIGLMPHERLSFSTDWERFGEMLAERLDRMGSPQTPDEFLAEREFQVVDEGSGRAIDTLVQEGVEWSKATVLRAPTHPAFRDGDEASEACPGPTFQGLGVLTRDVQSRDLVEGDTVANSEVGHIVLFPPEMPDIGTFLRTPSDKFWDPSRRMRDRIADPDCMFREGPLGEPDPEACLSHEQRWLTAPASAEILDSLESWGEAEPGSSERYDFARALRRLRQTAGVIRDGEEPPPVMLPPEQYLGEEIPGSRRG